MSTLSLPATAPRLTPLVVACLAATWLVWSSTYLAIKFALVSLPPFFQMGTRFLVAGGLLLAWTTWRGAPLPTARQWRNAALIGTLMLGGGMGGTAFAEQTISSGLVVAFIAVVPILIAVFNLPFGIRPTRTEAAGMCVGLAGVLMLTQGAGFSGSPIGLVAIVLACIAWSFGSVLSQRRLPLAGGGVGFASEMIAGGVVLMLMSWIAGERPVWPPAPIAVAAWLYLVVFGSLIAFSAYMVLLARTTAALASSYTLVNPLLGMLLGIAFAGETVTGSEWVAALVLLAGVVLLFVGRRAT